MLLFMLCSLNHQLQEGAERELDLKCDSCLYTIAPHQPLWSCAGGCDWDMCDTCYQMLIPRAGRRGAGPVDPQPSAERRRMAPADDHQSDAEEEPSRGRRRGPAGRVGVAQDAAHVLSSTQRLGESATSDAGMEEAIEDSPHGPRPLLRAVGVFVLGGGGARDMDARAARLCASGGRGPVESEGTVDAQRAGHKRIDHAIERLLEA